MIKREVVAETPPDDDEDIAPLRHSDPRTVVINKLPAIEVFRAGVVLLAVFVGAYLLWKLQEVIFLFFLAVLLATAIEPLVNRLRRGPFTRGTGTLVVYAAIILVIGLPSYLILPSAMSQLSGFTDGVPQKIQTLRPFAEQLQPRPLRDSALNALDSAQTKVQNPEPPAEGDLVEAGATAAHSIISFITVFVLALYWMIERPTIKKVLLRSVSKRWARELNLIWVEVEEKLGGWVRGQLLVMVTMAVVSGVGFALLGLPNPILLGAMAGIAELIPLIGPIIAFAPAVLVTLTIDPAKVLWVLIFALAVQQLESHVLVPRIMGHSVGISPLTVLVGILAGAALYGLPGAFLAVPIAGAVQVILAHLLRSEDASQQAVHAEIDGREPAAGVTRPGPDRATTPHGDPVPVAGPPVVEADPGLDPGVLPAPHPPAVSYAEDLTVLR